MEVKSIQSKDLLDPMVSNEVAKRDIKNRTDNRVSRVTEMVKMKTDTNKDTIKELNLTPMATTLASSHIHTTTTNHLAVSHK